MRKVTTKTVTLTIADTIDCGFADISELASEMGDWRDNMEEKLSHTEKYERVSEAADTLENNGDAPEYPEELAALEVTVSLITGKRQSRATRRDNAVAQLTAAKDYMEDLRDRLTEAVDELEEKIGELEGVEFPGMYG